jgi:phospho-N-acetylmuramoyl-pentapeptide-transferase
MHSLWCQPQVSSEACFVKVIGSLEISSPLWWCLGMLLLSCLVSMLWAPRLIGPLYKFTRDKIDKEKRPILYEMHGKKQGTPTAGGLLFFITTIVLSLVFLWPLSPGVIILILGMALLGLVGLVDDILVTWGKKFTGLTVWHKVALQVIVALVCGVWLYQRVGIETIHIPYLGDLGLGFMAIALFALVILATSNAVNMTDGLDGLAGGLSIVSLLVFLVIALMQGQWDVAVFLSLLIGSLLTFLWFNIYPARFIMGDIGAFSLGTVLALVAILTDTIVLLPIIGGVFVFETISVILQVFWRKVFKKKLFLIAPYHYHYERKGWPETKVTMRFWVAGALFGLVGLIVYMGEYVVILR